MKTVSYTMLMGSLNYTMLYTRPNIYFAVGMVNKYQLNLGSLNLVGVKHILKYLRRKRDYMIIHQTKNLMVTGCTNTSSLIVIHEI